MNEYEKELIQVAAVAIAAVESSFYETTQNPKYTREITNEVLQERNRQEAKWGDQGRQTKEKYMTILMEEVGEAAQAALENR